MPNTPERPPWNGFGHTPEPSASDLLTAAKAVIWKLNHNGDPDHNPGPVKISRLDATIRDLEAAVAKAEGR